MSKVLIIIGDASETVDTLYPYFRVQEAGFELEESRFEAGPDHVLILREKNVFFLNDL